MERKQQTWWDSLITIHKNQLLQKYYHIMSYSLDNVSENMIDMMYKAEHREAITSPTINNNSDKIQFASQMKDIPLEDRFNYAAAILLTCPIGIDDLSEMFLLLQKSLRLYKERNNI